MLEHLNQETLLKLFQEYALPLFWAVLVLIIGRLVAKETRRIDLVIGVGYKDDLKKVRAVLQEILTADQRVLKDPEPTIGLLELADSSVNFAVRPWVATGDYWPVSTGPIECMALSVRRRSI